MPIVYDFCSHQSVNLSVQKSTYYRFIGFTKGKNVSNPFESDQHKYYVLVNDEGQHSLWPHFADMPSGWLSVRGPDSRSACLEYVERSWTDMRPKSLIKEMEGR